MELGELIGAVDVLVASAEGLAGGGWTPSGDDVLVLTREIERLEAVVSAVSAAFDAGTEWAATGAKSSPVWVARRSRQDDYIARRRRRLGRAADILPVAAAAWQAGAVSGRHLDLLLKVRTPVTAEALARDEAWLVDTAGQMTFRDWTRALDYWAQHADPDGVEDRADRQRSLRRFRFTPSYQGMYFSDGSSDPVSGAIVHAELARLERQLYETDRAAARDRLGRDPLDAELARTSPQRWHDALVEMATRSKTASAPAGERPGPLFTVLVDYPTLAGRVCELANRTIVTPGTLAGWLDEASIERIVFAGPSRVLDVGAATRFFTGAARRAIEVRDRTCYHDECDEPANRCEIDHILPWTAGGPTTIDNGRLACGYHNRLRVNRPDAHPPPTPPPPNRPPPPTG